jgi:monoamine oxidase
MEHAPRAARARLVWSRGVSASPPADDELDVAIVGAGSAGTYVAYRLLQARPDWRIAIFERSNRIGGRLWSLPIHLCGEVFSRRQAWIEGALETADAVASRLLA